MVVYAESEMGQDQKIQCALLDDRATCSELKTPLVSLLLCAFRKIGQLLFR